ncbi:MAG: hypothetical protein JST55_10580 [Bacteroidetes bacterium]|nr:hypothetical protein [Bacteroidota bacterium]
MARLKIHEFELPGYVTNREWGVYIVVAKNSTNKKKNMYVGKLGDNNAGCNTIITRIGNHFSHNKVHSQVRNKINDVHKFDYKIFYITFGKYNVDFHSLDRAKINEAERRLNKIVQSKLPIKNIELLNPYKGNNFNDELLTMQEIQSLEDLVQSSLNC